MKTAEQGHRTTHGPGGQLHHRGQSRNQSQEGPQTWLTCLQALGCRKFVEKSYHPVPLVGRRRAGRPANAAKQRPGQPHHGKRSGDPKNAAMGFERNLHSWNRHEVGLAGTSGPNSARGIGRARKHAGRRGQFACEPCGSWHFHPQFHGHGPTVAAWNPPVHHQRRHHTLQPPLLLRQP